MKELKRIQALMKIGRIVSRVIAICAIVGLISCAAFAAATAFDLPTVFIGGKPVIQNVNKGLVYAKCGAWAAICAGEMAIAMLAERYFRSECAEGTPFTLFGAQQLRRLGVNAIVVPIIAQIIAQAVHAAIANAYALNRAFEWRDGSSVGIGIMMIVLSLVCEYGASLAEVGKK